MSKVVMAYSGGLETTVCIHWLHHRKGFSVITFSADLGQSESAEELSQRALALGVDSVHIADLRERFITDFAFPALRAGARSEAGSYLSVVLSRAIITQEVVRIAQENGCKYIAHGGRGKSNDQARFVLAAAALAPKLRVIAPLRESKLITRSSISEYAKKYELPVEADGRVTYNEDFNIWGTCISSADVEDLWQEVPESLFRITTAAENAPDKPEEVAIDFEHGLPVAIGGRQMSPVELVTALNELAGRHGVGRIDAIENFTVGYKCREVYEAPAAEVLFRAHRALEEICLPANVLLTQKLLSRQYSELAYRGDWFTPLREALDQFFVTTQRNVTGHVRMKLFKGVCKAVGRESKLSLYDRGLATGGENDTFDHSAAHGFLDIIAISRILEAHQREKE
jgi:argininosuccinate synthase